MPISTIGTAGLDQAANVTLCTTSGNLGVGVTPSAWDANRKTFQIGGSGALWAGVSGAGSLFLSNNTYFDGTNFRYLNTSGASYYAQATDGSHLWNRAASGTAGNTISFNQAMTLDASGNLGLGTSSPSSAGASYTGLDIRGSGGGSIRYGVASGFNMLTYALASTVDFVTSAAGDIRFFNKTSSGESMRITSGGRVEIASTGATVTSSEILSVHGITGIGGTGSTTLYRLYLSNAAGSAAASPMIRFSTFDGIAGTIISTTTSTTYATSSDYRLKENIAPMTGALSTVAQLKPCTYTWKDTGADGQGFIAHELQAVCPDAVTGKKDDVNEDGSINPQGIDTSFLVATLTAAIQELKAIVDAQAVEIAALKGRV